MVHSWVFDESEHCVENHLWCHVDQVDTCLCGVDSDSPFSMHDTRLCSNPSLWTNISCDLRYVILASDWSTKFNASF